MSMNYFIEPNVKTPCHDHFPEGLSNFFAQWGGYEDKSEVAQVEKILKIDLSTFQRYDEMDTTWRVTHHWKSIKTLDKLLNTLLLKIKAHPNYYKQVTHNPIVVMYFTAEMAEIEKQERAYKSHPLYGYPGDDGYLKSSRFVNDIKALRALLHCYLKAGATKVALSYY
jgi:hypothetical protein